ncbi:MAG: sensor histidine kinase, partial [Actinomycetota bacterium]
SLGIVGSIGYGAGVPTAYGWGRFTAISLPTAICLSVVGLSLAADSWAARRVSSDQIPKWAARAAGMTLSIITLSIWQAARTSGHETNSGRLAGLILIVGLLGSLLVMKTVGYSRKVHLIRDQERAARLAFEQIASLLRVREADLREVSEDLRARNESLHQFSHAVSHDLREPLRTIEGFAELLQDLYAEDLDERGAEYVAQISDSAVRAQSLVQALLSLAEADRPATPTAVDLGELFGAAESDLDMAIRESGAQILVSDLPVVEVDELAILQVVTNLFTNALRFQRPGTEPRILVDARDAGSEWEICVSDNGLGVPEDKREVIFEPFARIYSREEFPGTGIGLALCRKIVEAHGGRIWVEGGPLGGATFRFTLPKVPVRA